MTFIIYIAPPVLVSPVAKDLTRRKCLNSLASRSEGKGKEGEGKRKGKDGKMKRKRGNTG